jgi:glutamyl-tRNA reductase
MSPPLAVVGVSWRGANTAVRSQFAALAQDAEPIASLRQAGYVSGAACVTTCSRTEWIITADQPEWAGSLLRGALASRLPDVAPEMVQVRAGAAAVHYLLRVAVGLDSVAEGEGAVGRQLLKAFELARSNGISDGRLHRVWKHVERLIHNRRDHVPGAPSLGVQSLVREVLHERPVKNIAVLGRGEFGLAMERSLKSVPKWEVTTWTRQSMDTMFSELNSFDAVVVCTGASSPWLTLPARKKHGLVIDAGAPPQLKAAPGWTAVGLDTLLSRPELHLSEADRDRLGELVVSAGTALTTELAAPAPATALAAIDAERFTFLNEQLPQLLAGLPPKQARRVRQAVGAFTHQLLKRTREAS